MVKFEFFDSYNVSKHFVAALANGDESALNDDEEEQLDKFLRELPQDHVIECGEEVHDNFKRCDITGQDSDCRQITVAERIED